MGLCMLAGGGFIWLVRSGQPLDLLTALQQTMTMGRTYDLVFSLYLVMCLEIALRTSGTLSKMVMALQRLFSSAKVTLAIMPGFSRSAALSRVEQDSRLLLWRKPGGKRGGYARGQGGY